VFDPARIADDACAEGHLDVDPVFQVLLTLGRHAATGRLTVVDAAGENHLFFMQGRPVGVQLAERVHPLGQLLLELGRMNGEMFLRAQRLIGEGGRLPGQVFKELGVVDEPGLKETLAIQARRKAEHFCRLGSRPFTFCKGLMYLTGFASTPLDLHGVIYLAVRQQTGEQMREAWLEGARHEQVRLVVPGHDATRPVDHVGLPTALAHFGFGPPEERFLQRILAGWESVADLAETGTLPREEMATLLRYLEVVGRLQRRPIPAATAAAALTEPTFDPLDAQSVEDFAVLDVTSSESAVVAAALPNAPTPLSFLPLSAAAGPAPVVAAPLPSNLVSSVTTRPPGVGAAPDAVNEPSLEDVFSRPSRPPSVAPVPAGHLAEPDDVTDPRRPAVRRPGPPPPSPAAMPAPPPAPPPDAVFASPPTPRAPPPPANLVAPAPAGAPNPALHEPTPPTPAPSPVNDDMTAPVVRKKKTKRSEPLPSEVSAVTVSETRREKTMIASLPSIVIDDD
jgi:hypothetical protein